MSDTPLCGSEGFEVRDLALVDSPIFYSALENYEMSIEELYVINSLVCITKPKNVFEFGTYKGKTAINIAGCLEKNSPSSDAKVFTIDKVDSFCKEWNIENKTYYDSALKRIIPIVSDSTRFDFSKYKNKIDFCFIDAGHDYNEVMNDSKAAISMMEGSGLKVILWHDYSVNYPGVVRATWDFIERHKSGLKDLHVFRINFTRFLLMEWCNA